MSDEELPLFDTRRYPCCPACGTRWMTRSSGVYDEDDDDDDDGIPATARCSLKYLGDDRIRTKCHFCGYEYTTWTYAKSNEIRARKTEAANTANKLAKIEIESLDDICSALREDPAAPVAKEEAERLQFGLISSWIGLPGGRVDRFTRGEPLRPILEGFRAVAYIIFLWTLGFVVASIASSSISQTP